jgi:hypothetical protein
MGASLALAGLSACTKQPTEYIMPYVEAPEQLVPGKPLFYATAFPVSGIANPVLVETHEFRPTKVEGNPEHPASLGAADVPTQASILGLYDPDRLQTVNYIGEVAVLSVVPAKAFIGAGEAARKNGAGIRILTETVTSPTLYAQIQDVLKLYPGAKWYQWEPTGHGRRMGAQMAFGQFLNPVYKFDQADVVLSIDANFLANGPGGVRYARDFAAKRVCAAARRPRAVSTRRDHADFDGREGRSPAGAEAVGSGAVSCVRWLRLAAGARGAASPKFFSALVKDLQAAKGKSIVIAGEDQSPEVHAVVHYINQVLGNNGTTVTFTASLEQKPVDQWADMQALVQDLNAGTGGSAADPGRQSGFQRAPELNLRGAIQMAKTRVRLGLYDDETSEVCQWLIPEAHTFEFWSDAPAYDGTMTIIQPLIAPLYGGKSAHDLLGRRSPRRRRNRATRRFANTGGEAHGRRFRGPGGSIRCTTVS